MEKVYILSEHPDKEVEQAIHDMTADKLRVALYGIARGWKFDEAMDISIFIGMDKQSSWLEAAQHRSQSDVACTCDVLSVMGGVILGYKKDCPVASHAAKA